MSSLPRRIALTATALLGSLVVVAPASAATMPRIVEHATATLTAPVAVNRVCHETNVLVGDSVDKLSLTSPVDGEVVVRLKGGAGGDWDLALFDAVTGRSLVGSASFSSDELITWRVKKGQRLIAQGCRLAGPATIAAESYFMPLPKGTRQTYKLLRVFISRQADVLKLEGLGLDVTHNQRPGWADVVVAYPAQAHLLADNGFTKVKVLEQDMLARDRADRAAEAKWAAEHGRSALPSGRTAYRRYQDYQADMKKLVTTFPNLVRPVTMPLKTLDGRPVEGIELGNNVSARDGRPIFFNMGIHHAREWPAAEHPMEWAIELANGYGKDARITDLLNRARVMTLPIMNVDGFIDSRDSQLSATDGDQGGVDPAGALTTVNGVVLQSGTPYRRKNCRFNETDTADTQPPGLCPVALGVDPNRNYGQLWGGYGASSFFTDQSYRGAGPFSEPEVRNIRAYVSTHHVTGLITNHTNGKLILRPPGVKSQGLAPDEAAMKALGDAMATDNGYVSQYGWQLYDTTGTTEDWTYYATGGYGYTFEHGGLGFHADFQNDVVNEYEGKPKTKYAGKGNRAAYYKMLTVTADRAHHSVIQGTAQPGVVLRLRKTFKTSTSPVIYVISGFADDECTSANQPACSQSPAGPAITFDDKLDFTMVVADATGKYEWDVNPSTRPFSLKKGQLESYQMTCEDANGKVLDGPKDVTVERGKSITVDLCGGVTNLAPAAPVQPGGEQVRQPTGGGTTPPAAPKSKQPK